MASTISMKPMRGFRTPSTRRVPSRAPLSRRNASGSMSSVSHISSTTVSTANAPMGAPGARYAAVLGLFVTTS